MEKYRLTKKEKTERSSSNPNHIRITNTGKLFSYIRYAISLLEGSGTRCPYEDKRKGEASDDNLKRLDTEVPITDKNSTDFAAQTSIMSDTAHKTDSAEATKENNSDDITCKLFSNITVRATGWAITKAIIVCERIKTRIPNIHQVTRIGKTKCIDRYEPREKGLEVIERPRNLPFVEIILSKDINAIDSSEIGYQSPLTPEEFELKSKSLKRNDEKNSATTNTDGKSRYEGKSNSRRRRGPKKDRPLKGKEEKKKLGAGEIEVKTYKRRSKQNHRKIYTISASTTVSAQECNDVSTSQVKPAELVEKA